MKRLLMCILCLGIALSAVFAPVGAETANPTFTFSENADGTLTLSACVTGGTANITVPSEFGGKTVTAVGNRAFNSVAGVKSVTLPESITGVGVASFSDCADLTDISGTGVKNIGALSFSNCLNLADADFPNAEKIDENAFLNTAVINRAPSDSAVYIGKTLYRFKGTVPENTVFTVEDGTLSIADRAFEKQSGLTEIDLGSSLKYIGSAAFARCPSLGSIKAPDSLCSVGAFSFSGTAWYNSQPEGVVYIGRVAVGCKGSAAEQIAIAENTVSIADRCFYGCKNITSVTLPQGLETIGREAFFGCTALANITVPMTVTEIGYHAFGFYGDEEEKSLIGFEINQPAPEAALKYAEENGVAISDGKVRPIGDADGNGVVNSTDAILVLRYDAAEVILVGKAAAAADFDADGNINSQDAIRLLQYDAGI